MTWLTKGGVFFLLLLLSIFTVVNADEFDSDIIPGAYIVEFEDHPDNHENAFFTDLSAAKILAKPRLSLTSSLFRGTSFHLTDELDNHSEQRTVEQISKLKSVKKVTPMRKYSLPYEVISTGDGALPLPTIEDGDNNNNNNDDIQRRAANEEGDTLSTHTMTKTNLLRSEGYTGAGIRVAIIDTGVDYRHPDLGGCFGPGCKVSFGYDLVGDTYNGANEPMPDPDPYDDCGAHGTHVAGIIGARDGAGGGYFSGVAPNATLGAFRVIGCGGGVSNDVLIRAFTMAFESGADVITSSLGGGGGWSEEPLDVVVSRIVAAGTPVTVSAGNNGKKGPFSASTPAGAIGATAVGSVDNDYYPMLLAPGKYFTSSGIDESFGWIPGTLSNMSNGIYPLYAPGLNSSSVNDGCRNLPLESGVDLTGSIVLMKRGGCSFSKKAGNAAARGAKHVLFYNDRPGAAKVNVYAPGLYSAGMVPETTGKAWIELLASNVPVYLSLLPPEYAGLELFEEPNTLTGGSLSTYTSWGPSFEGMNKPQVSAPGGMIASTYPLSRGGYAVLSGTSMSCPFTAGAIALILEARGKLSPAQINNLLASTAKPASFHDGRKYHSFLAPVAQQGAGLIDAHAAVHATTLLNVSDISFNDTEHLTKTAGFQITNTGPDAVTYEIDHTPAATFYTFTSPSQSHSGESYRSPFTTGHAPQMSHISPSLTFSISEVTIEPGESVSIHIKPTLPTALDATRLPVYSGYITINSTHNESLTLPYSGISSALKSAPVLSKHHVYLSSTARPGYPWASGYRFALPHPDTQRAKYPSILAPAVYIELTMGTPLLRIDIQPRDIQANPSLRNKYNTTSILGEEIVGSITGFPSAYVPGSAVQGGWRGLLSDGSYAPEGNYTFLVRALRIFGDADDAADYEVVRTEGFGIWYG